MLFELLASPASASSNNGPPWLLFFVGPLFIIVGIAFLIMPQLQWKMNRKMNRWAYKNPDAMEPSAKGLVMTRITGAGMVIVATIAIIVALTRTY